jgi:hypothetical protein
LADSLQGEPRFWAALELPFRRFLTELPDGGDAAVRAWVQRVAREARDAFRHAAVNSLALSARELRARVQAEEHLSGKLAAILRKTEGGGA